MKDGIDLSSALAIGFGMVLVLEGVAYALFPNAVREMMAKALSLPEGNLRWAGLIAVVIGVGLVWLIVG